MKNLKNISAILVLLALVSQFAKPTGILASICDAALVLGVLGYASVFAWHKIVIQD